MLCVLGLGHEVTSLALEVLGVHRCESSVYEAVQAAVKKVPGLKINAVFGRLRTPVLGGDLTSVMYNGEWLPLGLTVDSTIGLELTVDEPSAEDAETLKEWLAPMAQALDVQLEAMTRVAMAHATLSLHENSLSKLGVRLADASFAGRILCSGPHSGVWGGSPPE